ncbi:MAG: sugar phosphate isomerase/epimerase [Clostridiales bacterium]|nr:sugar phosphate isomerase/epimerase [Clostridiales bacterium]
MKRTELAIATDMFGESERLEDLELLLKKISEAGFTHIHWCHEWDGDYIYSHYEMEQIREWMDQYNLKAKSLHATKGSRREVTAIEGHYRKDYTSEWEYNRKAGVELVKNRIDFAACIGAEDIVLHLYVPFASMEQNPEVKKSFYRQVEKSMDELQPYCLEKGVRICLESLFDMPEEYMLEQWDWVLEKYPEEFLGFCLDTGHVNLVWHEKLPQIIRKYGERIFAVHLHDNFGKGDNHLIPGQGNIDWKETMAAFAESAYELPVLLEVNCDRENPEASLKEAYEAGVWLDGLYHEALRKQ